MAEDNLTVDTVKELFSEALKPITERLDKLEASTSEPNPEPNTDDDEVKAMKAEIASLKQETATAQVDKLIHEGKILPAMKESAVKLAAADSKVFEDMYKDAPVIVDFDKKGIQAGQSADNGNDDNGDGGLSDDEKLIADVNAAFNHE